MLLEANRIVGAPANEVGLKFTPKPALCDLTIVEGSDAIAQVEADWHEIARNGGVATPFQSFPVASATAATHVRRGEMPRIVVARRAGSPVIIFPTVVTSAWFGQPVVRFLGDPLIQYGDILARSDASPEEFAAAWSAAVDPQIASLALFRRVRDDAKAAGFLAQKGSVSSIQESPLIHVGEPSRLSARDARELRRLRRRLAEQGALKVRFVTGPEAREPLLEALKLKHAWLKTHGLSSKVIGDIDWEKALCSLCQPETGVGALVLAVLTVGGRVAAIEAAFVDDTSWYAFMGAFSFDFTRMGPGQILTAECIARISAAGFSIYDQLPPSQAYKRRQATGSITVRDYAITVTPGGRLPLMMVRMVPRIKTLLSSIPVGLRRPILSLWNTTLHSKT